MSATLGTTASGAAIPDALGPGVADLLAGIGRNDPVAWSEVVRRYGPFVTARARAFRLQDADVHDAVQTTWLRLAERSHTVRSPDRLGGWLATTVTRECLRSLRRNRGLRAVDGTEDVADPDAGPEQRVVDAESATIVRGLVGELSPRHRAVLEELFSSEQAAYAELSSRTGIPVGSIGPTRARGLRQLRRLIVGVGLAPGA